MARIGVGHLPLAEVKRYDKSEKKPMKVKQPAMIGFYNKNMGGVDLNDMMQALYRIDHKSRKWYRRIFSVISLMKQIFTKPIGHLPNVKNVNCQLGDT